MSKYKALIRYEFKALRWVILYFMLIFGGYLFILKTTMELKYINFITHTGVECIKNIFVEEMKWLYPYLLIASLGGLLLLVYVQFKDAKNIEVGRFLKSLPIQSSKIYWVRIGCGMITYTVPVVCFVGGLIGLKQFHREWLRDYYSLGMRTEQLVRADSVLTIVVSIGIVYLILTGVYLGLVMMQYLVTNRIFSLIVGVSMFVIPFYIGTTIEEFFGTGRKSGVLLPLVYGYSDNGLYRSVENGEMLDINFIDGVGAKVIILLSIILILVCVGHISSKCFRVEDQGRLIPMGQAQWIFKIVGTTCIGLLPLLLFAMNDVYAQEVSQVMIGGLSLVAGAIGFGITHVIARIGGHER